MKVLYIADVGEKGGATNSLKEMTTMLNKLYNVEPIILTSRSFEVSRFAKKNNFETYSMHHKAFYISSGSTKIRKIIKSILRPYFFLEYKIKNKVAICLSEKYINFSDIDIIHSNVNRNDLGAILAKKHNIPHVWHIREFGELDYNCISLRKKYIEFMNENTTKFIAISKAIACYWEKKGIDKSKIEIIYNGIDSQKIVPKNDNTSNKINVIFSGLITENKGQIQAIKALALIDENIRNQIHLDIYGNGNEEYLLKLKKLIKQNDLEDIISFKGYRNDLYNILPNYHIGLICSKSEGFGRATVEYMFAKNCVIASNTGANTELIEDGVDGLLYEYGNEKDLAQKIEFIINNKDAMYQMSNNGYKKAKEKYDAHINAENIYKLYKSLI